MRRTVFGVLMSMLVGGLSLAALFGEIFAFLLSIYGFPFVILYGIPVGLMAHKLTKEERRFPALKRLILYIVMGGWLPSFLGMFGAVIYGYYDVLFVIVIVFSMIFAFGFWIGEELFERTKLKEWTEADLSKV
jgi:hypothetical protein